jgi:hypothetical protein
VTLPRIVVDLAYGVALLGLGSWASAATGDLARCAEIDAPDARLACYDKLAGRTMPTASAGAAPATAVPATAVPAPAAPAPAVPATGAAAAAAGAASSGALTAAAPSMPAEAAQSAAKNFGLTPAQQHKAPEGPASIQARITNLADRGGTPYVQLDNEQLWMVTDSGAEGWLNLGDPVTIKHAALGSFLLFTKSKRSFHARRVQ